MKLVVGLGNPGPQYEQTPHNIGFLAVDLLAADARAAVNNRRGQALTGKATIASESILLAKPETFMNLSGRAVRELLKECDEGFVPARDLIVLHDELAFPLGTLRVKERGSAAGHNGVQSVIDAVGDEFIRVRMGIAPDHPLANGNKEYVLAAWKKKDLATVGELVERAAEAVQVIVTEGVSAAMNRFNRREEIEAQS